MASNSTEQLICLGITRHRAGQVRNCILNAGNQVFISNGKTVTVATLFQLFFQERLQTFAHFSVDAGSSSGDCVGSVSEWFKMDKIYILLRLGCISKEFIV